MWTAGPRPPAAPPSSELARDLAHSCHICLLSLQGPLAHKAVLFLFSTQILSCQIRRKLSPSFCCSSSFPTNCPKSLGA